MTRGRSRIRVSVVAAAIAVAAVTALVSCSASGDPARTTTATSPSTVRSSSVAPTRVDGTPDADPPAPAQASPAGERPAHLTIAAIGVSTGLQSLAVEKNGALQTPSSWGRAGWFAAGPVPGAVGPAVIAGHVDSTGGPAVFFRLRELRPGDRAVVTRADGTRLTFVVDSTRHYPKKTFPTEAVYGPTSLPLLRLITCTGEFDRAHRSYLDNLVVTTHLVTT